MPLHQVSGTLEGRDEMSTLIEVKNLKKYFKVGGGVLHAVDDVSFKVDKGKTMGIVGESGCGKSTLGRVMIHLLESTSGTILFEGKDVTKLNERQLKEYRHQVSIIFQDPYSSLNPRMTVEQVIREALRVTRRYKKKEIDAQVIRLVDLVGLDRRFLRSFPHELDGGRRQRVGIARALAIEPKFIVCDEPVSALDVSIQAQILNLLMDLKESNDLTYVFISHNMSVVKHIADDICVMYLGQLIETCSTDELFDHPYHPYTQALLSAIPSTDIERQQEFSLIKGELTSPINPKPGCRFAKRCEYACEKCKEPVQLEELEPGHFVACCRARELKEKNSRRV